MTEITPDPHSKPDNSPWILLNAYVPLDKNLSPFPQGLHLIRQGRDGNARGRVVGRLTNARY
jgi:hypothetical protein